MVFAIPMGMKKLCLGVFIAFLIYFVLVILNAYRIFKLIPVYSG